MCNSLCPGCGIFKSGWVQLPQAATPLFLVSLQRLGFLYIDLAASASRWVEFITEWCHSRAQLLAQISSILEHRGCGRIAEPSPPPSQRFWNQKNYPWTLVRLLPNAQHYTVGRFYSRTEAEITSTFSVSGCLRLNSRLFSDADGVT